MHARSRRSPSSPWRSWRPSENFIKSKKKEFRRQRIGDHLTRHQGIIEQFLQLNDHHMLSFALITSKSSNNPLNVFLCNCKKSSDGLYDDKKEGDPLLLAGLGGYMQLPSENKFEYIVILYLRNITSPPRTGHYSKL